MTLHVPSVCASDLEQSLLDSVLDLSPWPVVIDDAASSPQDAIDRDMLLAERHAHAGENGRWLRLWHNRRCVVASRHQARSPHFARAKAVSQASGWPVATRRSGGTAVVHRPGIWNLSLLSLSQPGDDFSIGRDYDALLMILRDMLGAIGVACDNGDVPGSYCDGKYNLRWRGRKLAGTAACVTRCGNRTVRLFHASLLVSGSIDDDLDAIGRFEAALGEPARYDPAAHVTVRQILEGCGDKPERIDMPGASPAIMHS